MTLIWPEDSGAYLHPAGSHGRPTVARAGRRWHQQPVPLDRLPDVLRSLRGVSDVYLTPSRFRGARSVANLLELAALWVDLDYYRVQGWAGRPAGEAITAARLLLEDARIPPPTVATATGRGACLLWAHSAIPQAAVPRWRACQARLQDVLRPLGADRLATDAARVLRPVGTRHSGADALVEAIGTAAPAWSFDALADEILPLARHELAELRSLRAERARQEAAGTRTQTRPMRYLTAATYWQTVLADLQRLRAHRWCGQLPTGHRDAWMLVAASAMTWLAPPAVMRREIHALADVCAGWDEPEVRARLCSVFRRADLAAAGGKVEWAGRLVDPRYRMRASTIVDWLEIDEDEQRAAGLRVLVSPGVARALDAQRKRAERGLQSRTEYLASFEGSVERTRPWEALGISRATYYRRRLDS